MDTALRAVPQGREEKMRTVLFFREGYFYPAEYPASYDNWQAEAERNPGTTKIATWEGGVLWEAKNG